MQCTFFAEVTVMAQPITNITKPKNPEDDWKIWLVVNPSTWLIPIFFAVLLVALLVHAYAIHLPGRGFV
jgi:light-harvesting complex 1 alpha chain